MTEAAGHNRKQSPLRTSRSCRCISMNKNNLSFVKQEVQEAG